MKRKAKDWRSSTSVTATERTSEDNDASHVYWCGLGIMHKVHVCRGHQQARYINESCEEGLSLVGAGWCRTWGRRASNLSTDCGSGCKWWWWRGNWWMEVVKGVQRMKCSARLAWIICFPKGKDNSLLGSHGQENCPSWSFSAVFIQNFNDFLYALDTPSPVMVSFYLCFGARIRLFVLSLKIFVKLRMWH